MRGYLAAHILVCVQVIVHVWMHLWMHVRGACARVNVWCACVEVYFLHVLVCVCVCVCACVCMCACVYVRVCMYTPVSTCLVPRIGTRPWRIEHKSDPCPSGPSCATNEQQQLPDDTTFNFSNWNAAKRHLDWATVQCSAYPRIESVTLIIN